MRLQVAMKKAIHVQPEHKHWTVSATNEVFYSRAEAEDAGRRLAKRGKCDLIVHAQDGSIAEKVIYSESDQS